MIIDTHHHFWRYNPVEFGWIPDEMSAIRRHFGPEEFEPTLRASGVELVISVQARQSLEETSDLLEYKRQYPRIAGVVGWLPLYADNIERLLESFATHQKAMVGLRHVVQGEPDGFLDRDDFNRGLSLITQKGLVYDLLIFERQLPEAIRFVDRHPNQVFVLDHLAKPNNHRGELEPWKTNITELAKRPNVYCKLSGGVTEVDLVWTLDKLSPYFDTTLEAFGPTRLMFGSNWPLTESAGGYGKWLDAVKTWAKPLSDSERESLFAGCAKRVYLNDTTPTGPGFDVG